MIDQIDKILEVAKGYAFDAAVIPVEDFVFVPEYRKYCEENLCGNYNHNYACPPYSGTVQEMAQRTKQYSHALVLKEVLQVEDALNPQESKSYKKAFNRRALQMIHENQRNGVWHKVLPILSGPCDLCERCRMDDGEDCPYVEERWSCMSAYCIDVNALAERADMGISWNMNQVSLFAIICFCPA